MNSVRALLLAVGLLATAVATAQSSGVVQGGPRRAAPVSAVVAESAAANRPVEALVLLDASEVRAFEESIATSDTPLHQATAGEFDRRMADRKTLLDQLNQTTDTTERQMQELMNWAHEWLSTSERIMGHGKKTTKKTK